MNTKTFLGVEFWSGRSTTTGQPNAHGRMSTACDLAVFSSKSERDAWVDEGKTTVDMRGNCREAVTKKEARKLKAGWSQADFDQHLEMMLDAHRLLDEQS